MKTIPAPKNDRNQSTALLWTPLPEGQQEMLSGGAPAVRKPPTAIAPGAPGAPSGYSADPLPETA